ncbi:MAG: formylglycine-generating enzyme family protein [Pseudomonadota bacterium]
MASSKSISGVVAAVGRRAVMRLRRVIGARRSASAALAIAIAIVGVGVQSPLAQGFPNHEIAFMALDPLETLHHCPQCPVMAVVPEGRLRPGLEKGVDKASGEEIVVSSFALGVGPVTHDDWAACAATGAFCQSNPAPGGEGRPGGALPVVFVSWEDVAGPKGYVAWVNSMVGGAPYRLPFAAELELVARSAALPRDGPETEAEAKAGLGPKTNADAWRGGPLIVGGAASPSGRHNLRGDGWEWVRDCWRGSQTSSDLCLRTVLRSAFRVEDPLGILPANRAGHRPDTRSGSIGFRLARSLDER